MTPESKYKEQPLDDSKGNPFKVGDQVRGYCRSWIDEGEITEVVGEKVFINIDSRILHYKQCRLLELVEPREWWLFGNKDSVLCVRNSKPNATWDQKILVREVLSE